MKRFLMLITLGLGSMALATAKLSAEPPPSFYCPAGNFTFCPQTQNNNCEAASGTVNGVTYTNISQATAQTVNTCQLSTNKTDTCPSQTYTCTKTYWAGACNNSASTTTTSTSPSYCK